MRGGGSRERLGVGGLKARFHEPANHQDERNKTADKWKLTQNNRLV